MRISIFFLLLFSYLTTAGQTNLTIQGQTYTNSSDTWVGVNIPRSVATSLIFKNNTITSVNRFGYLLQAGDEGVASTNNNLDGALITGNRLNWSGSDMEVIPHGIFTGHNRNVVIKYNYLNNVPMGIIRKSANNMTNAGGGVAYNIVKGGAVGMVVKGMSNVNIFNNTFYNDRTTDQTWRPLVHIYTNTDGGKYSVAHGTKIFNNIFYSKHRTPSITIADQESLTGFECDYNVYWCETGSPLFIIGDTRLTFAEWQARGYDTHSVVMNPNFRDLVNFVPSARINKGRDLGTEWAEGLAVGAMWGPANPATAMQNGPWQVGAIIHGTEGGDTGLFEITQAVVSQSSPAILEVSFTLGLTATPPPVSAFNVEVNSTSRNVEDVTISGNKLLIRISGSVSSSDDITFDYTPPPANPIRAPTGELLGSVSDHFVINNIYSGTASINIYPNPTRHYFNISNTGSDQLPQLIRIFDLSGRLLYDRRNEIQFIYRVQINLAPGIYVLYLKLGASEHTRKLIVVD